jgi:hypothetical protein
MNKLGNLMNSLNMDNSPDENYEELVEMINCEKVGKTILKKTKQRYLRYLEGINDWTYQHPSKDDCRICIKHIKDHIEIFLKLYEIKGTLNEQIKLMEFIDYELYKVI